MKTSLKLPLFFALSLAALAPSLFAQLSIPSDGSDGALVISNNTVIDLSQAVSGNFTNNNTANAGKGIYDSNKWAVVFKYSSVSISNGATLTFINHPTHAPVVWLVNGDVTINGEVSLDGHNSVNASVGNLPEPGPGGFRGGSGNEAAQGNGPGFGAGGYFVDHGSYSTHNSYGNPQIVPLIGGSGGSGNVNNTSGSGGGGAILVAAAGTITCNGSLHANAGDSFANYYGSGGAIRLVANQILGNGIINAISGAYPGRIRLEANSASSSLILNPPTVIVPPTPLVIFPPTNAPTVQIISVAALTAPADPKAALAAGGDDLTLATTNSVAITLQTSNFPTSGIVNVYLKPINGPQTILPASFVSGNSNSANWQLTTTLQLSHTVIQARAVVP